MLLHFSDQALLSCSQSPTEWGLDDETEWDMAFERSAIHGDVLLHSHIVLYQLRVLTDITLSGLAGPGLHVSINVLTKYLVLRI